MAGFNPQQGFPGITAPLVDENGRINQVWLQLLITLWNRTGSGPGGVISDGVLLDALQADVRGQDSFELSQALQLPLPDADNSIAMMALMNSLTASGESAASDCDCCVTVVEVDATYTITSDDCGTLFEGMT